MRLGVLNGLSSLYKCAAYLQRRIRGLRRQDFPATILSIDNLSFGGTGKTPMVMSLGRFLEGEHIPFAIVTRGYRSAMENQHLKVSPAHGVHEIGDEAALYRRHFPGRDLYIGRDRVRSITHAIDDGNRLILLDDGFQSTHIRRDYRILLFNPDQPYFYLRHFLGEIGDCDLALFYRHIPFPPERYGIPRHGVYRFKLLEFRGGDQVAVTLGKRKIIGFSALGDNRRFERDLSAYSLSGFISFPDHHTYHQRDLDRLVAELEHHGADCLVCTEKDFVKLEALEIRGLPLFFAVNEVQLDSSLWKSVLEDVEKKGNRQT